MDVEDLLFELKQSYHSIHEIELLLLSEDEKSDRKALFKLGVLSEKLRSSIISKDAILKKDLKEEEC